jgi:putative phosphoesterase
MRIAVISDTHNRLPRQILAAISSAEEIWHLGDVVEESLLNEVRGLGPPVRVVRGNCDACLDWPLAMNFALEGFQIQLIHIPPRAADKGVQLLFHGHTHVPRNEVVGKTRFFNPGCITRPNRGAPASYAWLELQRKHAPRWNLVLV